MKKSLMALSLSALFVFSAAQATDTGASLNVSGSVLAAPAGGCLVTLPTPAVDLGSVSVDKLPTQGDNGDASQMKSIEIHVGSVGEEGYTACEQEIEAGKIAFKFVGGANNTQGGVLYNSATLAAGGATGVAVALIDLSDNSQIDVLTDTVKAGNTAKGRNIAEVGVQIVKMSGETQKPGIVSASTMIEIEHL